MCRLQVQSPAFLLTPCLTSAFTFCTTLEAMLVLPTEFFPLLFQANACSSLKTWLLLFPRCAPLLAQAELVPPYSLSHGMAHCSVCSMGLFRLCNLLFLSWSFPLDHEFLECRDCLLSLFPGLPQLNGYI